MASQRYERRLTIFDSHGLSILWRVPHSGGKRVFNRFSKDVIMAVGLGTRIRLFVLLIWQTIIWQTMAWHEK